VTWQGPTEPGQTSQVPLWEPGTGRFGDITGAGPDRSASEVVVASRSTAGGQHDGDGDSDGSAGGAGHVVTHLSAVTIRRPALEVAAYVFDPTTMPHWSGVLYDIEPVTDIEPRRGRQLRANLKILGVCLTVEGQLVDIDVRALQGTVRIEPVGGGGAIEHRLAVEELPPDGQGEPARSLLRFWNRVEVPEWLSSNVSDSLIRRFVDHTASFALANIKDILEHGEEGQLRQLQRVARHDVPTPTRMEP
jgi:hypothetical protein